jgi:hypothetical protein
MLHSRSLVFSKLFAPSNGASRNRFTGTVIGVIWTSCSPVTGRLTLYELKGETVLNLVAHEGISNSFLTRQLFQPFFQVSLKHVHANPVFRCIILFELAVLSEQ